ncbi:MAG: metalloregulator ArsR/SmtB family transcription factor [Hydrogenoanaerobacterium sp.]
MNIEKENDCAAELCDVVQVHDDVVNALCEKMPNVETLDNIADLFKNFADLTRVKILYLLHEAELCVCDIAALLDMSQSAISHQLRVLKTARLVKNRRDGKTVFYSLSDDHIMTILTQGLEHVTE